MGYIYKITNKTNGHSYIGQTHYSVLQRFNEHWRDSKRCDYKFSRALRKYGKDGFDICVIEEIPDEELNSREQYWIQYYDTFNNGYNSTLGGDGISLIDRDAIICSWESGLNIKSISDSLHICKTTIQNYLHDYEQYSNTDSVRRGKKNQMREVLQYDLNGNYVCSYESIADAAKQCNVDRSLISACCRKKRWSGAGYQWRYANDTAPDNYIHEQKIQRPVRQYDLHGVMLNEYESITLAYEKTQIHQSSISACCSGKRHTAGGFKWEYVS